MHAKYIWEYQTVYLVRTSKDQLTSLSPLLIKSHSLHSLIMFRVTDRQGESSDLIKLQDNVLNLKVIIMKILKTKKKCQKTHFLVFVLFFIFSNNHQYILLKLLRLFCFCYFCQKKFRFEVMSAQSRHNLFLSINVYIVKQYSIAQQEYFRFFRLMLEAQNCHFDIKFGAFFGTNSDP